MTGRPPIRVALETTARRCHASALDWPGWSRSGRTPEAAVEALAAAHPRYATVARLARSAPPADGPYQVVETRPGDGSTAFGIPAVVFDADRDRVDGSEAARLADIVVAAFATFDAAAAVAPASLRKGPRGGGRDRDAIVEHVAGACEAYARACGARVPKTATDAERRAAIVARLSRAGDETPAEGAAWPPRYAARRIAWHALDHAWEIEDRTER